MGQAAVKTEDALFQSAHSALVFAFNFSGQSFDRPLMNRLAAPAIGSGKGLVGLDGAAQSGMIRAEVAALGKRFEAALIARIAPRSIPCSCRSICCSGSKINAEWFDAITIMGEYATGALGGTATNGMMRRLYVERHFTPQGKRMTIEDIAEKCDINRQTAGLHFAKVGKALRELEAVAMDGIEHRLRMAGMIE